ncbi:ATP synthase subunit I [Anaeromicropila populeti]|uniref:ATP synthase I chain n=1 Tax=Anaeromicropila populeti TaxID=37658 RepID=A0A1I6I7S3_9FIRM|nr:ATP synthase subunit I [Anaeromicropila populeti]SFR62807.1 ATP synthase I chain [Anaeromicropila populeti]
MDDAKRTLKFLIVGILTYATPIALVGSFFAENKLSFLLGLAVGIIIAVSIAVHMFKSLDFCLDLDPESAEKQMKKKAVIRFVVMGLAVGAAFCFPTIFHPVGLFFGLMGLKISAYFQPFIHR